MDKNKKIMLGVGGGILLLCAICACVVGIGGFVYQDELSALLGLSPSQTVAGMLPADTQFYMETNPNLQNLPGYQNLKTLYIDNPDIQALLDKFEAEVSEEANITYEADIKPWLGAEMAMAVTDFSEAIRTEETPPIVVSAKTTNKEASDNFIGKVLAEAATDGNPFTDQAYNDITLHISENQSSRETIVLTTFDDFVIFSSSEALVKEMIDRAQGNSDQPSLVDSVRFKKINGELPGNAALSMYMEMSGLFSEVLADSAVELPATQTQDLEAFEAIGLAGTLQPDGVQFDIVVTYDITKMSEQTKASLRQPASPNQVLNNIPAEAVMMYNINNLNNVWQNAKQALEANPDFSETLRDFEQEVGLDIDQDIFGWMTGEFALVLLEVAPIDDFTPPIGGYALIGTDDVQGAQGHVDKVVGVLEKEMPFPLESQTIGGVEMNVVTDFDGAVQVGYGFYNNYFLLGYLEESIIAATAAAQTPITGSENFKAVQSRLPGTNYGYMYLDLDRGRQLVESQLSDFERDDYNQNVRPFLEPIHALGVSASTEGVEQGITKGVLFMLINE